MTQFTDRWLRGLAVKDKRYIKSERDGFYIEVMPSGEKSFRYRYRLNGRREKVTIGSFPSTTLRVARIIHLRMLDQVKLGESPALDKRQARLQAARCIHGTRNGYAPFADECSHRRCEIRANFQDG